MKIIIYGKGKVFSQIAWNIDLDNVVAVADQKAEDGELYNNTIPVVHPEKIEGIDYDYIVICSDRYFYSIKRMLVGEYFVDEGSILSWHVYDGKKFIYSNSTIRFLENVIAGYHAENVLDIGCVTWGRPGHANVDGFGTEDGVDFRSHYRNVYSINNMPVCKYDMVILPHDYRNYVSVTILNGIQCDRAIYVSTYSLEEHMNIKKIGNALGKKLGHRILMTDRVFYIFENIKQSVYIDCNIYVVSHKRYNLMSTDLYIPVCVGRTPWNSEFQNENDGENIAGYNERLNECTALYWIWKNTHSRLVGLNHYRRYFYNNNIRVGSNYLSKEKISDVFDNGGYDIILPQLLTLDISVYDNIRNAVGDGLAERCHEAVEGLLPVECLKAYETVIFGNKLYPCNMFVARRSVMEQYCEWLFSFIVKVADMVDVVGMSVTQKRTVGYFAEAMMTCWTLITPLKIYELPITDITKD
jgi:hypothetical protein